MLNFLTSYLEFSGECLSQSLFFADNEQIENALPLHSHDKPDLAPSLSYFQEAATIGLDAMQRANSTLEDFVSNILLFVATESRTFGKDKMNYISCLSISGVVFNNS